MCDTTQKPDEISPAIEANRKYFAAHLQVVHCDFERLKYSPHVLQNGNALTLIGACEMLLSAAVELQRSYLSVAQGQASNASQPIQQSIPKASNQASLGKSELEFTFAQQVSEIAKTRLKNHQKLKREYSELKTQDWVQLLLIKSEKAYKGLQVEIDGQQITIKTFSDYCLHAIGLSYRMVGEILQFLTEFGPDLFTALNSINTRFRDMRKVRKLSAEQKQALLQIAKTGDKAATLTFIKQALEAGE